MDPAISSHGHGKSAGIHGSGPHDKSGIGLEKAQAIIDACKWKDIDGLKTLAVSAGGFLNDELRRLAWPILLGISADAADNGGDNSRDAWKELPRHRDEDQVQLDVNRSFVYYPNDTSEAQLGQHKSELSSLIVEVLRRYPYLCYFQGYHDICQVFLLILRPACRVPAVARLSVLRIRDFMLPNLRPTTAQLWLLPDILGQADAELRKHIATIEPFYALAGTLTMYSHNIEAYQDIARLFDVFLSNEPVFTIYLFAQIVINRREEILDIDEPDMLQVILAKVPPDMDIDALIVDATVLYERFPPDSLRSWRSISRFSCLKTARRIDVCARQNLDDGHALFEEQAKEVQRTERRERVLLKIWNYRRLVKAISAATAVAAFAFYVRRNPSVLRYFFALFDAPAHM